MNTQEQQPQKYQIHNNFDTIFKQEIEYSVKKNKQVFQKKGNIFFKVEKPLTLLKP